MCRRSSELGARGGEVRGWGGPICRQVVEGIGSFSIGVIGENEEIPLSCWSRLCVGLIGLEVRGWCNGLELLAVCPGGMLRRSSPACRAPSLVVELLLHMVVPLMGTIPWLDAERRLERIS